MPNKPQPRKPMRKPKPRSNVSPSRRQEGGSIRSREASARMGSEGSVGLRRRTTRSPNYPTSKPRIVESGVGNLPMTVAKGIYSLIGKYGVAPKVSAKPTPKPTSTRLSGSTTKGVSKVTGGVLKGGKPVKYGPARKTLTPAQKAAQTRAMKKARATYAAEGPKKSVSAKSKKPAFSRKTKAGIGAVGAGASVAGISFTRSRIEGPKTNLKGAKSRKK